jgi:sugar phosphate isomerase/epimerase
VFSYWRTIDPAACFDRIAEAMRALAEQAAAQDLIIGVENEHACNVATGEETARLLAAVDHPNLQVVWDAANALVAGETPYPDGYGRLPLGRIAHIHAKDCRLRDGQPVWGPLGVGGVDWPGQMAALARDGYKGWISLETHWAGPAGDKRMASVICGRHLKSLVAVA